MALNISEQFKTYLFGKMPKVSDKSVKAVLEMKAEGATVPFMARYRKEKTGNLDETQIRLIIHSHETWEELEHRRQFVLAEIEKQGNLSDDLRKQLLGTNDLGTIEELYRPFKRKKKTKAKLAQEAGLQPFADWIWGLGQGEVTDSTDLAVKAKEFINAAKGFVTYEEVLRGAQHIISERIYNNPELRTIVREDYFQNSQINSQKSTKFKPHSKFETYADYKEPVKNLWTAKASHRYLALRRGWHEGELKVTLTANDEDLLKKFEAFAVSKPGTSVDALLKECAKTAFTIHVVPSVTNELHSALKEKSDEHAINVFAENLRRVLMASPFGSKVVLGIDPGLRSGCKIALVDQNGNFISHTVMQTLGDKAMENAKKLFAEVLGHISIQIIAIGNGTGGREAETFIRKILKELEKDVPLVMVNESGASVYSASEVAKNEFPDLDLTVRGAISIARRLQDPLAELVKIDPKSIGVGQYQHDVSQPQLKRSLGETVESCVNQVGVELNTASSSLLQYVSGIGPAIAQNIIDYRKEKGGFKSRQDLLSVKNFSSKVFEQSAGFLRIAAGEVPLDRTGIHPERYAAVKDMLGEAKLSLSDAMGENSQKLLPLKEKWAQLIGEFTFDDVVRELNQPGRDPREIYKVFKYRDDIHKVDDLKGGMICPGLVTNVTNFGAFVDIGVHQDGLVHISEMTTQFVSDPRLVVSPGDQVQVKVLKVDKDKSQISLSMLVADKAKPQGRRPAKSGGEKKLNVRSKDPKGGKGKRPRRGPDAKGKGKGSRKGPPARKPNKPFNNPFASLGDLKKS